jgi:hypothetical protein
MLIECQKCHEAHPTKLCPHAFMIVDDAPKKMTMEDFISLEEQYGCTLRPGVYWCCNGVTSLWASQVLALRRKIHGRGRGMP